MPETTAQAVPAATLDLAGRRFYKPGVLAVYCLFVFPLGLLLYGLNLVRRDQWIIGYALIALSSALMVGAAVATFADSFQGSSPMGGILLSILIAIYVSKVEDGPYKSAMQRGGRSARWWPPVLLLIGGLLVFAVVAALMMP